MANEVIAEGNPKDRADRGFRRLVQAVIRKLNMAENDASLPNAPPERHDGIREEVDAAFASIRGLMKASFRPLPTQTGDGSYIEPPVSSGVIKDLQKIGVSDVETLIELVKTSISGQPTDDRTYFMERLIKCTSELPLNSKNGMKLTDGLVGGLWADLQHPPTSYLGEKHMYRKADGSFNNPMQPQIGAAGTPYARSVRPQTVQPAYLPEPEALFDSVMVRKKFVPHPNKISSMLFYLASIIIHDLFRTDHVDKNISLTSSYLDLSPLYGSNQDEQNTMRTFESGKIHPDCFSEKRLLGFPPGVGVLLITFNRFHNYVVEQLAEINESGRFTKPDDQSNGEKFQEQKKKFDNDLFQTARLITCGLYVNCILKDYVRTILNLNQTNSPWDLDPRVSGKTRLGGDSAPSVGNQVSAEFNLVYRWHAAVSERDDKWTQDAYRRLFPGKNPKELGTRELLIRLGEFEAELSDNPLERPFANLDRDKDGKLSDDALVEILADSIEDVAGSFGANRVPEILRSVEILGIKQARSWNLASLNEFREFFGLAKHERFEDISSDPYVVDQLKHLYDHPDFVELYPGLVVEDAKDPMTPGSGLCPSYTVSRAILSDAVSLVRGDRFYMIDYTPKNLTNWGFNEVKFDVNIDQGHVMYKLLLRAFPNHIRPDSVYAHFPLVIPSKNKEILKTLKIDDIYTYERPKYIPPPTFITSYKACASILDNKKDFKVTWGEPITFLMHTDGKEYGADFMLSGDLPVNEKSREIMGNSLYRTAWDQEVRAFYENITLQLLHEKSYKIAGVNQVDIVRDIGNLANVHFAAEVFCYPLKTEKNPRGIYSESELYTILALVFMCIFFDVDPTKSFQLRQASRVVVQQLGKIVLGLVEGLNEPTGLFAKTIEMFHHHTPLSNYGTHMIQQLLKVGLDVKDLVWSQLLPSSGAMVANQAQLFAQCLDFYLSEDAKPHLKEISRLAKLDTKEADELILRYFMEGTRLRAVVALFRDVATSTTIQDGSKSIKVEPGQRLVLDLVTASHDPNEFPDPEKVKLDRPLDSYIHYGWGPHICLGYGISKVALTTMLKTVCKLDNLRRAPGLQGQIKQVAGPGGITKYMTADNSSWFPFPTTMKVQWDGDLPPSKK